MTPQKWHSKYKPDYGSAAKYDLFEQAKGLMHVSNTAEERAEGFKEYFAHTAHFTSLAEVSSFSALHMKVCTEIKACSGGALAQNIQEVPTQHHHLPFSLSCR